MVAVAGVWHSVKSQRGASEDAIEKLWVAEERSLKVARAGEPFWHGWEKKARDRGGPDDQGSWKTSRKEVLE